MVCSATAASTRGTRRSSIFATVNLMFGTCATHEVVNQQRYTLKQMVMTKGRNATTDLIL